MADELPVLTTSPPAIRFVPGTQLVIEPTGFDGGWTIYQRACDACMSRPCTKHLALVQQAYLQRAAAATARLVAAGEGSVVAEAEEIAATAVASLVSA